MSGPTDAALVAFAEAVGPADAGPVSVRGGGTHDDVGGKAAPGVRRVDAPDGIVDLRPDEMVAQVRAGTPLAELDDALAEVGQTTALPEPHGAATVGGAVALGRSGLRRLGRGQLRDAVLQIRYVDADGQVVVAGGPTVKNVTGFDLVRLLVGSLGTLGCIGDVMVRTRPRPAHSGWWRVVTTEPRPLARLRTAASVLWNGTDAWLLLEGHAVDVAADRDHAEAAVGAPLVAAAGPPPLPPHRWSCRPGEIAAQVGDTGGFVAEIGVGIVYAERPAPAAELSAGVQALHDEIRRRFDPTGRLNPGRRPECR